MVENLPAMQETWVQSLGQEEPLEEEMATHSSILAWRIPWTEEPGGLQSMGLQSLSIHTQEPLSCFGFFFFFFWRKLSHVWLLIHRVYEQQCVHDLPMLLLNQNPQMGFNISLSSYCFGGLYQPLSSHLYSENIYFPPVTTEQNKMYLAYSKHL